MGTNFDIMEQTLIFDKWDINDKKSCLYKVTNNFNEGVAS